MRIANVRPLGWGELVGDYIFWFLMKMLMIVTTGDVWERSQRTHPWNNQKGRLRLDLGLVVGADGDPEASKRRHWKWPTFHTGGWRKYVVVSPVEGYSGDWYPGWDTVDVTGFSRLPLTGPVRLLRGKESARFFGLDSNGMQIPVRIISFGRLGDRSEYRRVPLR